MSSYTDPLRIAQIQHYDMELVTISDGKKIHNKDEVKVIKDLLYYLTHSPIAMAVSANQRGYIAPIFATKWDIKKLSDYSIAADLTSEDYKTLHKELDFHVYRNPMYFLTSEESNNKVYTKESCLSYDDGHTSLDVWRFKNIRATVDVLDMKAYRANRGRAQWTTITTDLTQLGAQVFQHEFDHILGYGIWDFVLHSDNWGHK